MAYRKSQTDKLSKENLIAWLRCGEIEAEKIEKPFKSFNKDKLRKTLPKLRKLTMKEPDTYSKEFFSLLFMCGIILVYVPYLKNTFVNGAVRWLNSGNPLIQIAPRFKREDALLFTIFHEIGHIIKHGKGVGYINLEKAKRSCLSQESVMAEQEADNFALNTLIKKSDWTNFIKNKSFSPRTIKEFANEIKISKSVVAGRLAFELNNYARFQHLFKKIDLKRNP